MESLLAHDRSDDFLEVPAAAEAARLTGAVGSASLAGQRIGRFAVLERIASGGMGEVYAAHDDRLQRRVAIKRLPAHLSADADRVRRFRQEVLATSALNHPNIVTVHEIVEHEGGDLLVTELVDGVTLRTRAGAGALPLDSVLDIGLQIARGLAAAHAIGIVHRDVKPDNVMIRSDGLVKLLDFGIAKSTRGALEDDETATSPGAMIGTIGYMSPEQARGLGVDARSDVWSLGVILYELATGESPFSGPTPSDRLAAILERDPILPSQRREGLPAQFDRFVARALAKDPARRYADAAEVVAVLDSLSSRASAESGGVRRRAAALWRALSPHRFPGRVAATVGAVLGLAVAAAAGTRHCASRNLVASLAVLPFENRSADPDVEYLGDGLAESLIDQLSRLQSLRVMARATVFRFRDPSDPLAAGLKLGVGAVLTGTVSRRDGRLSISAELVQTSTGVRLWGESYDRPVADLLLVQDSIATNVAERLHVPLSRTEKLALRRHGTDDPTAYEQFLKAVFWLAKDTEEGDLEARRLFQRAVELDPRFVEPRIGIAITHARAAVNGYARPDESWPRVDAQVAKALEIDPGNILALCQHVNRLFLSEWDFGRVEREYRELMRDPRLPRGNLGKLFPPTVAIVLFQWVRGFTIDAVDLLEKALEDDPGNTEIRLMLADFLTQSGRLEPAIAQYRAIAEAQPEEAGAWFGLAGALKRRGDLPGAIGALRKAYELSGEQPGTEALASARTEKDYENAEVVVARWRLSDLEALARERYVSPLNIARLHAQVGDRESAFAALEEAFAERSPGLVFLKVDAAWDRIRDDARFAVLVRRVGIP